MRIRRGEMTKHDQMMLETYQEAAWNSVKRATAVQEKQASCTTGSHSDNRNVLQAAASCKDDNRGCLRKEHTVLCEGWRVKVVRIWWNSTRGSPFIELEALEAPSSPFPGSQTPSLCLISLTPSTPITSSPLAAVREYPQTASS